MTGSGVVFDPAVCRLRAMTHHENRQSLLDVEFAFPVIGTFDLPVDGSQIPGVTIGDSGIEVEQSLASLTMCRSTWKMLTRCGNPTVVYLTIANTTSDARITVRFDFEVDQAILRRLANVGTIAVRCGCDAPVYTFAVPGQVLRELINAAERRGGKVK